jgi:hypothetical protein
MSEFRTTPQRSSGWRRFSVATLFVFMAIGLVTVTLMLPTAFAAFLAEDGHQRSRRKDLLAQRPEGIQMIHHLSSPAEDPALVAASSRACSGDMA